MCAPVSFPCRLPRATKPTTSNSAVHSPLSPAACCVRRAGYEQLSRSLSPALSPLLFPLARSFSMCETVQFHTRTSTTLWQSTFRTELRTKSTVLVHNSYDRTMMVRYGNVYLVPIVHVGARNAVHVHSDSGLNYSMFNM